MQNRLKEVMAEKHKSIYSLSKETGIATSTISLLCNNPYRDFKKSTLSKLCDGLGCNPSDILVTEKDDAK